MARNTKKLSLPKPCFSAYKLRIIRVDPGRLIRISTHKTGEPFFNNSGRNRFDDPARKYKTCYFGFKLSTAICETLLHDTDPVDGYFNIHMPRLMNHNVYRYHGTHLNLANLTGAFLKRLGLHAELSGTSFYDKPQKWSEAIHNHPSNVDGFLYMSRHLNTEKAAVLFDRAKGKIHSQTPEELIADTGFPGAARLLGIRGIW
jgi:hypothetical protein